MVAGWLLGPVMVDKDRVSQFCVCIWPGHCAFVFSVSRHLIPTEACLTDEETEAQGSQVTCLNSLSWDGSEQPGRPDP